MLPIVYRITVHLHGHCWLGASFIGLELQRKALAITNAVNAITCFEAESTRLRLRLRACLEKSYFFITLWWITCILSHSLQLIMGYFWLLDYFTLFLQGLATRRCGLTRWFISVCVLVVFGIHGIKQQVNHSQRNLFINWYGGKVGVLTRYHHLAKHTLCQRNPLENLKN